MLVQGVLLYGPPGTGKTLLARAVAHHTDCTFIRVSGSELVQKYIGEGSRMVRELFVMARYAAVMQLVKIIIAEVTQGRKDSGWEGRKEGRKAKRQKRRKEDGWEGTKGREKERQKGKQKETTGSCSSVPTSFDTSSNSL